MHQEDFLQRLMQDMQPSAEMQQRMKANIRKRISCDSPLFGECKRHVTPSVSAQSAAWQRIASRIELPVSDAFTRWKVALAPSPALKEAIFDKVLPRLQEASADMRNFRFLKWTAAFALFALIVRVSPFLFIASHTEAETQALLMPTRGDVLVSIDGVKKLAAQESVVQEGALVRTSNGEASIVLHDDGVVRLDEETIVELHDLSDRLEPASEMFPSFTLHRGRIWVVGLVPESLRGFTVSTRYGQVTVHEGSVSIAEDDVVDIAVYDRRAVVSHNGKTIFLTAGERLTLEEKNVALVKKVANRTFQTAWVDQNLGRDAVHRHDIAQIQHERRIAQAGILPTSPLYPVKRLAETVDVLLTFSQDARVQKKLALAETRLNEAAALLNEGEQPDTALEEYKETLQNIASGDSHGSLAEFLVKQALLESTAQISAALPGDESYVIKKTVLEASAGLPDTYVREEQMQGMLLLDGLASITQKADSGEVGAITSVWNDMQPYMAVLEEDELALNPAVRKEAQMLLSFLADAVHEAHGRGVAVDPELLEDMANFLPTDLEGTEVVLSEEEIMEIVQGIRQSIFLYDMTRSRINQFIVEIKALEGHPDQGRILRRLAVALPDGPESFPKRVYKEIVKLRWQKAGETVM